MTYLRALRDKEEVYWIVVDSEAAMLAVAQARKFGDQYQLMPAMLAEWMQKEEAARKLANLHKERFSKEYMENSGLPPDWFTAA